MRHFNSKNLALRDPALATLMGAIKGSDFGAEYGYDFGADDLGLDTDFGDEYGDDYGDDYGADDYGDDHGDEHGDEMGGPRRRRRGAGVRIARPLAPPPAVAAKMWAKARRMSSRTEQRRSLIEPNRGSRIKIERYAFSINQAMTLGLAVAINATGQPDTNIRPQRVTMNAPSPGFVTVAEIKVANVSVTVGGTGDAFEYGANGVGQSLDMPTLSPANRATVLGNYTGFVPPGFVGGSAYLFVATFKGPASIVA